MRLFLIFKLLTIVVVFSCCKEKTIDDFPNKPLDQSTQLLIHKACNNFNQCYLDYSFIQSLENLGGIEVDILLSKDTTIWLRHDAICIVGEDTLFFNDLSDKEIISRRLATTTLEDLFRFIAKHKIDINVSLDLKEGKSREINARDFLVVEANAIIELQKKYTIKQLMVETYYDDLKELFSESHSAEVYFICWGNAYENILKALSHNYDGLSIDHSKITKNQIQAANSKGLKVQVWTPKSKEAYGLCVIKRPQFIQSDYIIY